MRRLLARTLLTALSALALSAAAALAGPASWQRPEPQKPKAPCCATCLPGGACCTVQRSYSTPAGGRGLTITTRVLCKDTCLMPQKERGCCTSGCVR